LSPKNFVGFVKNAFFEEKLTVLKAKRLKIRLQKQLWQQEQIKKKLYLVMCLKDQLKLCKTTTLSFHALPEK
jgi:16S rRNA U1498 N3-methylase RsmE